MSEITQLVVYLGVDQVVAAASVEGIVEEGEPVVLITVRPEPVKNFHIHHIAITQPQALRLLEDLHNMLDPVLSDTKIES